MADLTISEQLEDIYNSKKAIKQALLNKGQNPNNTLSTYANIINNLELDKPSQSKTVTPTTSQQIVTPDTGYKLSSVVVNAVTANIDSNIKAENIKKDIYILRSIG